MENELLFLVGKHYLLKLRLSRLIFLQLFPYNRIIGSGILALLREQIKQINH